MVQLRQGDLPEKKKDYSFRYNNAKSLEVITIQNPQTQPSKFNFSFCMRKCFQTTRLISAFVAFRVHFTRIIHVQIWSETKTALFSLFYFLPQKKKNVYVTRFLFGYASTLLSTRDILKAKRESANSRMQNKIFRA